MTIKASQLVDEHRWSGWPGAWCLDCGCEDPREIACADGEWADILDGDGQLIDIEYNFDPKLMKCPAKAGERR